MSNERVPGHWVTTILVVHDGAPWLPQTISALFQQTRQPDRIIAVDTSSLDNSPSMVKNAKIELISADRGEGFGDAIKLALGHLPPASLEDGQEEFLWILHDDVAPSRECLELLIEEISRNPLIAATGPKLRGWNDNTHLLEVGVSIAENGARWTGVERHEKDQGQHDGTHDVLAVSTAAMLARRSIFEDLGGFDSNLALFRDDVDFGWRARTAGYTVTCMSATWALHAEAGANELRTIDVDEAFLHRPLLLDRRNAAYVLFANSSAWILPWVLIQLVVSSLFRAGIDLLAKLPGYAGDELAALGLLLSRPSLLLKARRMRKKHKLLSSRTVRPFIPPRSEQMRSGFERLGGVISESFTKNEKEHFEITIGLSRFDSPNTVTSNGFTAPGFTTLGLGEDSLDEYEQEMDIALRNSEQSIKKVVRSWPAFWGALAVFVFSTLLSRNRFGDISGGGLLHSPHGSFTLLQKYFESWHQVGMGSALSMPPWIASISVLSFFTLSSPSIFLGNLFWLAPFIAFFVMYRTLKKVNTTNWISVVASVLYALSPTLISALNQGRLGTVFIALVAPVFISLAPISSALEEKSWRRIYALGIFASIISFFSPIFLALWSIALLVLFVINLRKENLESKKEMEGKVPLLTRLEGFAISKRLSALFIVPWLLTEPWSLELLLHPIQFLLSPGFPMPAGNSLSTLLFNPGGQASLSLFALSPFIFLYLAMALTKTSRRTFLIVSALLLVTVTIAPISVAGHGSVGNIWTGDLLLAAEIFILLELVPRSSALINNLKNSSFNLGHVVSALIAGLTLYSLIATFILAPATAGSAPVQSARAAVNPAFLTSLSEVSSRPKLLAISSKNSSTLYYVSRGNDLELGDADVTAPEPAALDKAVFDLINGVGVNSGRIIGAFGISYIFVESPVDNALVHTIDGNGSFVRSSITNAGVVWKVIGAIPRVSYLSTNKTVSNINSEDVSASGKISTPGTLNVAENYDSHWDALLNGKPLKIAKNAQGLPSFIVTQSDLSSTGNNQITVVHTNQTRRIALAFQVLAFLVIFVLALPAGRRRGVRREI
jgi:GT2 family glycosyltransferase